MIWFEVKKNLTLTRKYVGTYLLVSFLLVLLKIPFLILAAFLAGVFLNAGLLGTIAAKIRDGNEESGKVIHLGKKYFGKYLGYNVLVAVIVFIFMLPMGMLLGADGSSKEKMVPFAGLITMAGLLATAYMPALIFYKDASMLDVLKQGAKLLVRGKSWTLILFAIIGIRILFLLFLKIPIISDFVASVIDLVIFIFVCTLFQKGKL